MPPLLMWTELFGNRVTSNCHYQRDRGSFFVVRSRLCKAPPPKRRKGVPGNLRICSVKKSCQEDLRGLYGQPSKRTVEGALENADHRYPPSGELVGNSFYPPVVKRSPENMKRALKEPQENASCRKEIASPRDSKSFQ